MAASSWLTNTQEKKNHACRKDPSEFQSLAGSSLVQMQKQKGKSCDLSNRVPSHLQTDLTLSWQSTKEIEPNVMAFKCKGKMPCSCSFQTHLGPLNPKALFLKNKSQVRWEGLSFSLSLSNHIQQASPTTVPQERMMPNRLAWQRASQSKVLFGERHAVLRNVHFRHRKQITVTCKNETLPWRAICPFLWPWVLSNGKNNGAQRRGTLLW